MKRTANFILLFAFIFVLSSCNNSSNDCISGDISFTSLEEEYGCFNTANFIDINLTEDYTIIRDQATYDASIIGNCAVVIDFSTYDLVIGKKTLTTGLQSIAYEVENNCNTGSIDIVVNIGTDDTTIAPNITYHVLIPKQSQSQNINVSIVIN